MAPTPPLGEDRLLVVDLGVGIIGNYCTKLLADGGANVIKVETPEGDPLRARRLGRRSNLGKQVQNHSVTSQTRALFSPCNLESFFGRVCISEFPGDLVAKGTVV